MRREGIAQTKARVKYGWITERKGKREEAAEVAEARRQRRRILSRAVCGLISGEGWRLAGSQETSWEATEMVAYTGSWQWERWGVWRSKDVSQVEGPGVGLSWLTPAHPFREGAASFKLCPPESLGKGEGSSSLLPSRWDEI